MEIEPLFITCKKFYKNNITVIITLRCMPKTSKHEALFRNWLFFFSKHAGSTTFPTNFHEGRAT